MPLAFGGLFGHEGETEGILPAWRKTGQALNVPEPKRLQNFQTRRKHSREPPTPHPLPPSGSSCRNGRHPVPLGPVINTLLAPVSDHHV